MADRIGAPREQQLCYFQQSSRNTLSSLAPRSLKPLPLDSNEDAPSMNSTIIPNPASLGNSGGDGESGATDSNVTAARPQLSWLGLLGLIYCLAIGGGYGLEDSVGAGGALLTIVFIFIIPFIWGMPVAMVVSELSTAIPTNAGFLMWINVAFPNVVYVVMVILTIILIFIDNALYPTLFSDYVCKLTECTPVDVKLLRIGMLLVSMVLNIAGIEAVGSASVIATFLSVAPFLAMFFISLVKQGGYVNWHNIGAIPNNVQWATFLPTVSWNLSGLEQAGSVAEEIDDPQRTIMKSMIPLMLLAYLTYIPPVIAGVSQTHGDEDWNKWKTGYWANVADQIAGNWFKIFTVAGGSISAMSLAVSSVCATSRNLAGIAETGAFPTAVNDFLTAVHPRFLTPYRAIVVNTAVTGLFATFLSFGTLVKIDQFCYGIRVLMIFLTVVRLRYIYPDLPRPFKIPLSDGKLVLALAVPMIFSIALTVLCMLADSETFYLSVGTLVVSTIVAFFYCRLVKPDGFDGKIVMSIAADE